MTEIEKARIYDAYLETDHFQSVRLAALANADWKCQTCSSRSALMVHHNTYESLMCESPADVFVMCEACHTGFHSTCRLHGRSLAEADYGALLAFCQANVPVELEAEALEVETTLCLYCGKRTKLGLRVCGTACQRRLEARNLAGYDSRYIK